MTLVDHSAASLLLALGAASIKAAAILALAALTMILLRRRSAALRHLIWISGLGATVAVLILPAVLPAWRVVPLPAVSFDGALATSTTAGKPPGRVASIASDVDSPSDHPTASPSSLGKPATVTAMTAFARLVTAHAPSLALFLWIGGAIGVASQYSFSTLALARLTRRAVAVDAVADAIVASLLGSGPHITRAVSVLRSDDVALPLTWGILRPCVLLPSDASDWSAARLACVLRHELAHVKRLDAGTQLIAYVASALFWFHPLVWYAATQMRHERERACDDDVLAQGAMPSQYAGDLLALVRTYGQADRHGVALAMARRSQFEGRLLALLDPAVDRGAVSSRQVALILALATFIVVPTAALRGEAIAAMPTTAIGVSRPAPAMTPVLTRAVSPAPVAEQRPSPRAGGSVNPFDGCGPAESNHDHRNPVNGQLVWTASASDVDCRYELTAHGDITFSDDVTSIAHMARDTDVEITTNINGATTHLLARGSADGITYEFARGGASASFDAAGQAWLAAFLTILDRHTAFAIDERLPLILRTGGVPAVLDEIARIRVDHARMLYLLKLTQSVALDDHAVDRTLDATATMRSGHDKVEVLVGLARSQRLSSASRRKYMAVAATLEADHDRRRVLEAISRS